MGCDAAHATAEAVSDVPHGAAARALPPCDLVMKGGITSGLVYPGVIRALAGTYRFSGIGGSSAGAIAAAFAAAMEYGRQVGRGGGIAGLDAAVADLQTPGRLFGLFQPTADARPLFDVLLAALATTGTRRKRATAASSVRTVAKVLLAVAIAAIRRRPLIAAIAAIGVILLAGLATATLASFAALPLALDVAVGAVAVVIALLVFAGTALAASGLLLWRTVASLGACDYGMCPGTRQGNRRRTALIDWLHAGIQECAGLGTDAPLTFRQLEHQGIRLTMLSTDLSLGRPIRVPDDLGDYAFDPRELAARFPDSVVEQLLEHSEAAADPELRMIPVADLPVLVGVRLSLSFPVLLSAMPLHLQLPAPGEGFRRHLLSDGGIGSNFPLHFFDAWLPGHPTFGIDLVDRSGGEEVSMHPDPETRMPPRRGEVTTFPQFVTHILDTMQNWRDVMQSELPGFRDRVCTIPLQEGQGGLHFNMDERAVRALVARGDEAGKKILATFDDKQWEQHRWVRYLTLMAQLQNGLHRTDERYGDLGPRLRDGLPAVTAYRYGRDRDWCRRAERATAALLDLGRDWGPVPLDPDFRGGRGPEPEPVMRLVPRA